MQICLCAVLLWWGDWNCCPLNNCCSPVIYIHTRSCYFRQFIAVPLTVNKSASPSVIQREVTIKTGRLLVLQCAAGEVGVFCNFVPRTGGSIHVNRREHTSHRRPATSFKHNIIDVCYSRRPTVWHWDTVTWRLQVTLNHRCRCTELQALSLHNTTIQSGAFKSSRYSRRLCVLFVYIWNLAYAHTIVVSLISLPLRSWSLSPFYWCRLDINGFLYIWKFRSNVADTDYLKCVIVY